MPNKMIIDASHPEETRVVVLRGNRVEEFDFESANKKPLRGNIYLAKVTRVEPSLQAAFVDYGGNRHGFLAFSEIHPDYYQIPVADRQALLEEEARSHHEDDEEPKSERRSRRHRRRAHRKPKCAPRRGAGLRAADPPESGEAPVAASDEAPEVHALAAAPADEEQRPAETDALSETATPAPVILSRDAPSDTPAGAPARRSGRWMTNRAASRSRPPMAATKSAQRRARPPRTRRIAPTSRPIAAPSDEDEDEDEEVTTLDGGAEERAPRARHTRQRGRRRGDRAARRRRHGGRCRAARRACGANTKSRKSSSAARSCWCRWSRKSAATRARRLTTYLSLAGRYSVLMPNTARGGGISRKITNSADRKRLKSIAQDLEVPEGMGVILRTAGASRTKAEIKRDFEYLLRMWETVRELTLSSSAPTLVYEEGSLIKRAIRDLYNKDVEEIVVAGEDGYREAKDFMRMLMPSHAKNVQPYRDIAADLRQVPASRRSSTRCSPIRSR